MLARSFLEHAYHALHGHDQGGHAWNGHVHFELRRDYAPLSNQNINKIIIDLSEI